MMPKLKLKPFILCSTLLLSLIISLAAWSVAVHHRAAPSVRTPSSTKMASPYDAALLAKLKAVLTRFDLAKRPYMVSGTLDVTNQADTTENLKNADFLFSRNGNDCYYRIKTLEMLNANGVYLFIDHTNRKIALTTQKAIVIPSVLGGIDTLQRLLSSEKYGIQLTYEGAEETITLLNEHHVSCKEYRISFDTTSYQVNRIYSRFTDINHLAENSKDKIVDVRILRFSEVTNVSGYLDLSSVVQRSGKGWQLTPAYASFQLIQL